MAHITRFSVKGLAGRQDTVSLKLNRDLNVFFGSNGSGKTSLLRILHSALDNDPKPLADVPFREAEVEIFSVTYDITLIRKITQRKGKEQEPQHGDVRLADMMVNWAKPDVESIPWSTIPGKPPIPGLYHCYLPISRLYSSAPPRPVRSGVFYAEEGTSRLSEEELDRRFAEQVKGLWAMYSSTVSRAVREAQQSGLARILREVLVRPDDGEASATSGLDAKEAYRRVASFLAREPGFSKVLGSMEAFLAKYEQDKDLRKVVRDIEEVEREIEKATAPREKLAGLIDTMFIGGKHLVLGEDDLDVTVGKGQTIGLPFLSSGEKQLLYILIQTLNSSMNTILIDEPELSMHVDWQKALLRSMQTLNPSAQIIVATHSPEIMADVTDDKIFRL